MPAQTHTLEYRITEQADGSTPAPQFDIRSQPDEGIYRFTVARLGLIDLSFSGPQPASLRVAPSTIGQRYISWFWAKQFVLSSANPIRSANDIEGAGYVDVENLETLPLASSSIYSLKGYVMPHGTVLRLQDMLPAVPGVPIVVRFSVIIPQTPDEDAKMRESFCCSATILPITA